MEGFGFAAADAVLQGIPVVATRVGAVPEIVRNATDGAIVEYGDVDGLGSAIARTVSNPPVGRKTRRNPLEPFLSWDWAARETLRIYEDLLGPGEIAKASS